MAQRWPEEEIKEIDPRGRETRRSGGESGIREQVEFIQHCGAGYPATAHVILSFQLSTRHICVHTSEIDVSQNHAFSTTGKALYFLFYSISCF